MIHIWAGVFVSLGLSFGKYLLVENYTNKYFNRTLIGAVANIILNYFLIPRYGIKGAAIATLIGQFIANYGYDFFDKDLYRQLKIKTMCFFPFHLFKKSIWLRFISLLTTINWCKHKKDAKNESNSRVKETI